MNTVEKSVQLDETTATGGAGAKPKTLNCLQRTITKAWILLVTNEERITEIDQSSKGDAVEFAKMLSGMDEPPQQIVDLAVFAMDKDQIFPAEGLTNLKAFQLLRSGFQERAQSAWAGGGTHPRQEELDLTL